MTGVLFGLGLSAVCAVGALVAAAGAVAMAFPGRPQPWATHLLRRTAATAVGGGGLGPLPLGVVGRLLSVLPGLRKKAQHLGPPGRTLGRRRAVHEPTVVGDTDRDTDRDDDDTSDLHESRIILGGHDHHGALRIHEYTHRGRVLHGETHDWDR